MAIPSFVRSSDDRVVAGVCASIAQTLGVDPTLVRLAFVAFTLAGGSGVLAYLILAIIMPLEPAEKPLEPGVPSGATTAHTSTVDETRWELQENQVPETTYQR